MAKQLTNSAHAKGIATAKPTPESWVTFDSLPARVRRALWEAPTSISPESAKSLATQGEAYAVAAIRDASQAETIAFARQHRIRHGYDLPHVAAQASAQLYNKARKVTLWPKTEALLAPS